MRLTPIRSNWHGDNLYKVEQSNGIRQFFYLSTLDKVTHVRSYLLINEIDSNNGTHNMPSGGGNWYYSVNGNKYYLSDYGGWSLQSYLVPIYMGNSMTYEALVFEIPVGILNVSNYDHTPGEFLFDFLFDFPAYQGISRRIAHDKHDVLLFIIG